MNSLNRNLKLNEKVYVRDKGIVEILGGFGMFSGHRSKALVVKTATGKQISADAMQIDVEETRRIQNEK